MFSVAPDIVTTLLNLKPESKSKIDLKKYDGLVRKHPVVMVTTLGMLRISCVYLSTVSIHYRFFLMKHIRVPVTSQ